MADLDVDSGPSLLSMGGRPFPGQSTVRNDSWLRPGPPQLKTNEMRWNNNYRKLTKRPDTLHYPVDNHQHLQSHAHFLVTFLPILGDPRYN